MAPEECRGPVQINRVCPFILQMILHHWPPPFVYWGIQRGKEAAFLLSDEMKGYLTLAAACTGGMAVLLAPASIVTLGLGTILGYKGKDYIKELLEGGGQK